MQHLPTSTVTFLFTDIEGSTRLAKGLGDRWPDVLEQHHRILREAIGTHNGVEIQTEGEAFFAPVSPMSGWEAVRERYLAHIQGVMGPEFEQSRREGLSMTLSEALSTV